MSADPNPEVTPILVVEDDQLNRAGVVMYLQMNGYAPIEAGDQQTAYELALQHRPPVAVVDIVIPSQPDGHARIAESVGLRLVRDLKALDPTMGIVVLSAYEDRGADIWSLVRDGTRGIAYLLKGVRPEQLLSALGETRAGQVVLSPDVVTNPARYAANLLSSLTDAERPWVERALSLMPTLSPRELDVARRIAASHNNQGIADALEISAKTVENHVNRLYAKLGLDLVDTRAPTLRKSTLLAKTCMLWELLDKPSS